jgi:hypothetical protein
LLDSKKLFVEVNKLKERSWSCVVVSSLFLLELINFYKKLLGIKQGGISKDIEKLEYGLEIMS